MRDDAREIIDLVLESGRFQHTFVENGTLFVANGIDCLTGLCIPSVRAVMGMSRIDYELALVVVNDLSEPLRSLVDAVAARRFGRFVCLPKTVTPAHSLDMLATDGRMSDWLISEMIADMHRCTLDKRSALNLINSGGDRFIENLKMVFKETFREDIEVPLAKLA